MASSMTGFIGFPDIKMKPVVIPDHFFTELLPQIDDLAELKLTLHCFWLLNAQEGELRYLRGEDLRQDTILLRSLTLDNELRTPQEAVEHALQRAVARNTLLKLEIETDEIAAMDEEGEGVSNGLGEGEAQLKIQNSKSKIQNPKSKIDD